MCQADAGNEEAERRRLAKLFQQDDCTNETDNQLCEDTALIEKSGKQHSWMGGACRKDTDSMQKVMQWRGAIWLQQRSKSDSRMAQGRPMRWEKQLK